LQDFYKTFGNPGNQRKEGYIVGTGHKKMQQGCGIGCLMKGRPAAIYNYFIMKNTYSVAKAQANFTKMLKEAEKQTISITRHDETVAFILSRERMEAIIETLEVMGNPEAMKAISGHQSGKLKFQPLSVLDDD
jgi:PHD/YefM family antitoxin component YafN of YafNO toxin-antitoxin module